MQFEQFGLLNQESVNLKKNHNILRPLLQFIFLFFTFEHFYQLDKIILSNLFL